MALVAILVLAAGFGGGFGAGWAARSARVVVLAGPQSGNAAPDGPPAGESSALRPYVPLDFTSNLPNDRVALHYLQAGLLTPGFHAVAAVVATLAGPNASAHDAVVMRSYALSRYAGSQDTLARLFSVAQKLQAPSDYMSQLHTLVTALTDVFAVVRDNLSKLGGGGYAAAGDASNTGRRALLPLPLLRMRRPFAFRDERGGGGGGGSSARRSLLTAAAAAAAGSAADSNAVAAAAAGASSSSSSVPYVEDAVLFAFVRRALSTPPLAPALAGLSALFGDADLVSRLVCDVFFAARGLAAQLSDIAIAERNRLSAETAAAADGGGDAGPGGVVTLADGSKVEVTVDPYVPAAVAGEVGDDSGGNHSAAPSPAPLSPLPPSSSSPGSGHRRRLQDATTLWRVPDPPAGFTPDPPAALPDLLLPTVWHVLSYSNADGSLGPPGIGSACTMVGRLVREANARLAPARVALFVRECRANSSYRYLVRPSRQDWLACSAPGLLYDNCGEVIRPSAVDFPRSLNFYVAGEEPPAGWSGYSFGPYGSGSRSATDPLYGHIGLTWTTVSTDGGTNNRASFEAGAFTLVHQVARHLGLVHTFSEDGVTKEDAVVRDTAACATDADAVAEVVKVNVDVNISVTDTPTVAGPVWAQPFALQAYTLCLSSWSSSLSSSFEAASQQAAVRVGAPAGDQNPAFDSCPAAEGVDELGNYLADTFSACLLVSGHFTSGQVAALHRAFSAANPTAYKWGQYYARNPPPEAALPATLSLMSSSLESTTSNTTSGTSGTDAATGTAITTNCASTTRGGCKCSPTWDFGGSVFHDCVVVPGHESRGAWCTVSRSDGDCTSMRNGWWDFCTPNPDPLCKVASLVAGLAGTHGRSPPMALTNLTSSTISSSSSSSPPSPQPMQPDDVNSGNKVLLPGTADWAARCGPGAVTRSGLRCTSRVWSMYGMQYGTGGNFTGCANPNADPAGSWCVLARGQASAAGNNWDYCSTACVLNSTATGSTATGATGEVPYPYSMQCAKGVAGLPPGCTCAASYGIRFDAYGTSYGKQHGCTAFRETGGAGLCVVTCVNNKAANRKAVPCGCAA